MKKNILYSLHPLAGPHLIWKHIRILCLCLGCLLCQIGCAGQPSVLRIAMDAEDTQSQILAYMAEMLAEQQGYTCEMTSVEGGIRNVQPALENGQFDIYPQSTAAVWSYVLKKTGAFHLSDMETLEEEYKQKGLIFENLPKVYYIQTYAVRSEEAKELGITTLSQLAQYSDQLVLGASTTFFEREDLYVLLQNTYDFKFKTTQNLPRSMQYSRLKTGEIQVMPVTSLDGRLEAGKMIALEDDKNLLPDNTAGYAVSLSALQEHAGMNQVFHVLAQTLSAQDLEEMNREVTQKEKDPQEAARAFLQKQGLIPFEEES